MSELFFVIKSFIISIVLIMFLQVKLGNTTVENHTFSWIHGSAIGKHLAKVAEGGTLVIKNGITSITQFISKTISGNSKIIPETTKASRLNFEPARPEHGKSENY